MGLWRLPRLEDHQYLCDIASLGRGLRSDQPYQFSLPHVGTEDVDQPNQRQLSESAIDPPPSAKQASSGLAEYEKIDIGFECLVTPRLGRPVDTFSSLSELVAVLCNIVRALRPLYVHANILYRDVSPQNIM